MRIEQQEFDRCCGSGSVETKVDAVIAYSSPCFGTLLLTVNKRWNLFILSSARLICLF